MRELVASGMPIAQAKLLLASQQHLEPAAPKHGREIRVHPEDEPAILLFQEVCWQWRTIAGFNGVRYLALDRATYEPAMRMLGIARGQRKAVLAKMRIMEKAARNALQEAQKS